MNSEVLVKMMGINSQQRLSLLVIFLFCTIGLAAYLNYELSDAKMDVVQAKSSINIPISSSDAVSIVKTNETVKSLIAENFQNPQNQITNVVLKQNPVTKLYFWHVEMIERECGCVGISALSVINVELNPVSGKIQTINLTTGILESEYARQTCEKTCH